MDSLSEMPSSTDVTTIPTVLRGSINNVVLPENFVTSTVLTPSHFSHEIGDVTSHMTPMTVGDEDPSLPVVTSLDAGAEFQIQNCLANDTSDEPTAKRWRLETPDGQIAYMVLGFSDNFETGENVDSSLNFSLDDNFLSQSRTISRATGLPMDITQAWLTSKNDKDAAAEKGQRWKQGQWSKEEIDILQNNITSYCQYQNIANPTEIIFEMSKDERKDFYRCVAKGLQRPLFAVYRRVIRMYDNKNHIGKYTREETQQLKELKKMYGTDWSAIGTVIGRSAASVKDKSRLIRDSCNSGKWTGDEERLLADTIRDLTQTNPGDDVTAGISWSAVARRVGTRSEKQCRTKWLNYLNWKLKGGLEWTRGDDLDLIQVLMDKNAEEESDINWVALCEQFKSARSPQWLRGKWWSLKKHVADYQSRTFQDILINLKETYANEEERRRVQSELTKLRLAKQKGDRILAPLQSQLEQHLLSANDSGNDLEIDTAEMDDLCSTVNVWQKERHSARTGAYVASREDRTDVQYVTSKEDRSDVQYVTSKEDRIGVQLPSTIELDGQQYILERVPGVPVTITTSQDELSGLFIKHDPDADQDYLVTSTTPGVVYTTSHDVVGSSDDVLTDVGGDVHDSAYLMTDGVGEDQPHVITVTVDQSDRLSVTHDTTTTTGHLMDYELPSRVTVQSEALTHPGMDVGNQSDCLVHDENSEYHSAILTEHVVKVDLTSSNFPQLSSLSDPMLPPADNPDPMLPPTDNPDLMASSDLENEKSTNHDDS